MDAVTRGRSRGSRGRGAAESRPVTREHAAEAEIETEIDAMSLFRSIAKMQNPYGAWSIHRALAEVLCIDLQSINSAIRTETTTDAGRLWATSLVLAFLEL